MALNEINDCSFFENYLFTEITLKLEFNRVHNDMLGKLF